jgi:hypothetical protein
MFKRSVLLIRSHALRRDFVGSTSPISGNFLGGHELGRIALVHVAVSRAVVAFGALAHDDQVHRLFDLAEAGRLRAGLMLA